MGTKGYTYCGVPNLEDTKMTVPLVQQVADMGREDHHPEAHLIFYGVLTRRGNLKHRCIDNINELLDTNWRRMMLPDLEMELSIDEDTSHKLTRLETWLQRVNPTSDNLECSTGWTWCEEELKIPSWLAPNPSWRRVVATAGNTEDALHIKWPNGADVLAWKRWKTLWEARTQKGTRFGSGDSFGKHFSRGNGYKKCM
ncbi:hypothetical protein R1sor_001221 [Riccia sorocarpa]|uniref:Uncharacterized protein n=1 Tax=Riccia sorocarpa TaxID=122646 RepID=A0ABD3GZA9_9MARC